jgi:N,N'-diacetyllegionaminate synthase
MDLAKQLIDVAASAGADYVKFQTFKAEKLVQKKAGKAAYQIANTGNDDSQFDMLKKLELSEEDHQVLIDYCRQKNIQFLSTAFDMDSVDFLKDKIAVYKIPSGEITNLPYLQKVAGLKLPIILSTGMATMQEVKDTVAILTQHGTDKNTITVLHCNTEYPTPMQDVNLLAMQSMQKELNVAIGYSDHTLGIEVPIAAVALGATVIEKHFTVDRNSEGPDHKASLEPEELKAMIKAIRNIEQALGNGIKMPSSSEQKNIAIARKSIVAGSFINAGDIFTEENLTVKRPGNGISPMQWNNVLGKKANKDFEPDDLIEL